MLNLGNEIISADNIIGERLTDIGKKSISMNNFGEGHVILW